MDLPEKHAGFLMRNALKAFVIVAIILTIWGTWSSPALQYALIFGVTAMKIYHLFIGRDRSETGKET
ncbi:MAG: hypothetical protein Q4F18_06835 [Clostridia bacterium]|nr:hypothetical protein [Clostridia bacterium]